MRAWDRASTSSAELRRERRRPAVTPLVAVIAILISALVVAGAFGASAAVAAFAAQSTGQLAPPAPKTLDLARPAPAAPAGAEQFRSCSIDDITSQAGALDFHGYAINSQTGEVLFDRRGAQPNPTASTLKLVVAAAALSVLGPDHRIPTRAYRGEIAGEVVLVGGGDPTLSSFAPGQKTYYDGATAHLSELADQVRAKAGTTISSVSYDDSVFGGAAWHPSWNVQDRLDGYIAPVTGLMIDGDRAVPASLVSLRTEEPSQRAAASFADRLRLSTSAVLGSAKAPKGAELLGEVWSQPVSELVKYSLLDSDNNVSEALARLVAIELGAGNTFDAVNPAMQQAMTNLGLDGTQVLAIDGSGLSAGDRVTAHLEVALLQLVIGDRYGLGRMMQLLPASGLTGSLDTRFDPATSGVPGGAIRAKTGFIDQVYGLAGFIDSKDATKLTFAFYVVGKVSPANRDVLDGIAAAAYRCGDRLADW